MPPQYPPYMALFLLFFYISLLIPPVSLSYFTVKAPVYIFTGPGFGSLWKYLPCHIEVACLSVDKLYNSLDKLQVMWVQEPCLSGSLWSSWQLGAQTVNKCAEYNWGGVTPAQFKPCCTASYILLGWCWLHLSNETFWLSDLPMEPQTVFLD